VLLNSGAVFTIAAVPFVTFIINRMTGANFNLGLYFFLFRSNKILCRFEACLQRGRSFGQWGPTNVILDQKLSSIIIP
jgi:hypothetical protein